MWIQKSTHIHLAVVVSYYYVFVSYLEKNSKTTATNNYTRRLFGLVLANLHRFMPLCIIFGHLTSFNATLRCFWPKTMATSCQDSDFFPGIIYYLFSRSFARWLAALSFTSYPLIEQQLDNLSRGFFHSRHIKVKLLFIYELHIWSKSMAKSISFLQLFLRDIFIFRILMFTTFAR